MRARLAVDTGDLVSANEQAVQIRSLIKASHEDSHELMRALAKEPGRENVEVISPDLVPAN